MAEIDYYLFPLSPFSYLAGDGPRGDRGPARGAKSPTSRCSSCGCWPRSARPPSRTATPRKRQLSPARHLPPRPADGAAVNLQPRYFPDQPGARLGGDHRRPGGGGGDVGALVHGFLRAVWAEERDIAEDDVVRDVLVVGLRPGAGRPRAARRGRDARAQHRRGDPPRRLRRPQLPGGEEIFWGQDRLPLLEAHLASLAG